MLRSPYAFKLMPSKDIAQLLSALGVPNMGVETIERPTPEVAANVFQHIAHFAYDTEVQQVKACVDNPSMLQHMEIWDEAVDVVTIFRTARQLAMINRVEDFNLKDMWEPSSKRFRTVCSGMINFCKYKDSKISGVQSMKEELAELDVVNKEYVEKSGCVEQELMDAQARHQAALPEKWQIENDMQEAQSVVDKLQKQRTIADRVQEDAETKKAVAKERLANHEDRAEQLRKQIENLKEQVAESPEGLEQEIQELQQAIKQQKTRVGEKGDEKRSRQQRVQVLTRLNGQMEQYGRILEKVGQAASQKATTCERTRACQQELVALRKRCEAARAEKLEHQQAVQQVTAEMDAAKEAHAEQLQQFEQRRQQAMVQLRELQSKRTEEQRQFDLLEQQRLELLAEMSEIQREESTCITDLQERLQAVKDEDADYMQTVDALLANYDAEFGRTSSGVGRKMTSPASARGQRYRAPFGSKDIVANSCSPGFSKSAGARLQPAIVPRRLVMDR